MDNQSPAIGTRFVTLEPRVTNCSEICFVLRLNWPKNYNFTCSLTQNRKANLFSMILVLNCSFSFTPVIQRPRMSLVKCKTTIGVILHCCTTMRNLRTRTMCHKRIKYGYMALSLRVPFPYTQLVF